MMMTEHLILKRAAASRSSGEWNDDDYDVLADGIVVGRIMKGMRSAGGDAMAVDAGLWAARGPHADPRLRADTRGGNGGLR
jgi:hypothetical protein